MVHDGDDGGAEGAQTDGGGLTDPAFKTDRRATASAGAAGGLTAVTGAASFETAYTTVRASAGWALAQAGVVDDINSGLCEMGAGVLITGGIYIFGLYVLFLAIKDLGDAFAASNKRTDSQVERRDHIQEFVVRLFGVLVIWGAPILLASIGFPLLECVDAINVFGN